MRFRKYQKEAVWESIQGYRNGAACIILCMPTGAGKTAVAGGIIQAIEPKSLLYVAPHREICHQSFAALKPFIGEPEMSQIFRDGFYYPWAIAHYATLSSAIQSPFSEDKSFLVFDECSRMWSPSGLEIIAKNKNAPVLGLTAIHPSDGDLKKLPWERDKIKVVTPGGSSIRSLTEDGYLSPSRQIYSWPPNLDYEIFFLSFFTTRKKAKEWALDSKKNFLPCDYIGSETNYHRRRNIIDNLRNGKLSYGVSNVAILNEGIDIPRINAIYIDGGGSDNGITQKIGRALRPSPGKEEAVYYLN